MADPKLQKLLSTIARKLCGLAARVEAGEIQAFDIAWLPEKEGWDQDKLYGRLVVTASAADDYIDCLESEAEENPVEIQSDIARALSIVVEDRTLPEAALTDGIDDLERAIEEAARQEDEDAEDFHLGGDPDEDAEDN